MLCWDRLCQVVSCKRRVALSHMQETVRSPSSGSFVLCFGSLLSRALTDGFEGVRVAEKLATSQVGTVQLISGPGGVQLSLSMEPKTLNPKASGMQLQRLCDVLHRAACDGLGFRV